MAATFDVIIIGLGAMGSAAAYHLAKAGKNVLGLDRFTPPHTYGSSHGKSRIIREAYFEDPLYVPLVQRAYELWEDLQHQTGRDLLRKTGGLMIGRPDGVLVQGAERSATEHHLQFERLTAAELHDRFPALSPIDEMVGILEPRAGILFPETCIEAHLEIAIKHGATLRFDEPITDWKATDSVAEISTPKGRYEASQILFTTGSWIPKLIPSLKLPLKVNRQVLFWFKSLRKAEDFYPERCPIHIWEYDRGKFFYGFPDLGDGVKLAGHYDGKPADPDTLDRTVHDKDIATMRSLTNKFLPNANGPLQSSAVCMYTNTPDCHFLIDFHPQYRHALIASPCSGHGFKFSSAVGEILADLLITGRSRFDLRLFSLSRFAVNQTSLT